MRYPKRIEPTPGQESVWDYPRPPRLEPTDEHVVVVFNGAAIADTTRAFRVLETSHPPNYYIPPGDVLMDWLFRNDETSWCEWKGRSHYYNIVDETQRADGAAWGYDEPTPGLFAIRGYVAFYAGRVDACYVDGEHVIAQPGGYYGGWITSRVVGPFKGAPGTMLW